MGQSLSRIDLDDGKLHQTGHICPDCAEELVYTAEVVLLQIQQPHIIGSKVLFTPVVDEAGADGGFIFEPYFYCFSCWEGHFDDLRNEVEDTPPVEDMHSIIACTCCGSGIREDEYVATFHQGEFHVSPRSPNNIAGPKFVSETKAGVLCLLCITIFNDNYIEMWDDLNQFGECCDCIERRCWRANSCGCDCHETTTTTGDDNG